MKLEIDKKTQRCVSMIGPRHTAHYPMAWKGRGGARRVENGGSRGEKRSKKVEGGGSCQQNKELGLEG